jgi:hypothetical protein
VALIIPSCFYFFSVSISSFFVCGVCNGENSMRAALVVRYLGLALGVPRGVGWYRTAAAEGKLLLLLVFACY